MTPTHAYSQQNRGSDAARLVESLTIELAGEKIDLPSFPEVAVRVL
jgi:hypothetical protein